MNESISTPSCRIIRGHFPLTEMALHMVRKVALITHLPGWSWPTGQLRHQTWSGRWTHRWRLSSSSCLPVSPCAVWQTRVSWSSGHRSMASESSDAPYCPAVNWCGEPDLLNIYAKLTIGTSGNRYINGSRAKNNSLDRADQYSKWKLIYRASTTIVLSTPNWNWKQLLSSIFNRT